MCLEMKSDAKKIIFQTCIEYFFQTFSTQNLNFLGKNVKKTLNKNKTI